MARGRFAFQAGDAAVQQRHIEHAIVGAEHQIAHRDRFAGFNQFDFAKPFTMADQNSTRSKVQTSIALAGELNEIAVAVVGNSLNRAGVRTDFRNFAPNSGPGQNHAPLGNPRVAALIQHLWLCGRKRVFHYESMRGDAVRFAHIQHIAGLQKRLGLATQYARTYGLRYQQRWQARRGLRIVQRLGISVALCQLQLDFQIVYAVVELGDLLLSFAR